MRVQVSHKIVIFISGALLVAFAVIGSALGTHDLIRSMTGDDMRAWIMVLTVEGAFAYFAARTLLADDPKTFWLAFTCAVAYFIAALLFQLADGAIHDQNGVLIDVARIDYRLRWVAQNLVWIPATATLGLVSLLEVLDKKFGTDMTPIVQIGKPQSMRGDQNKILAQQLQEARAHIKMLEQGQTKDYQSEVESEIDTDEDETEKHPLVRKAKPKA